METEVLEPVKMFNKYYCPKCERYLGKITHEGKMLMKEDKCLRCNQLLDWSKEDV